MKLQPSASSIKRSPSWPVERKKMGAGVKWDGPLIREMLALSINTNLDNGPLLSLLRGSNIGTTRMQNKRGKYCPGATWRRWRPQDHLQMHKRICHLRTMDKPGRGPRIFTLDFVPRLQDASSNMTANQDDLHADVDFKHQVKLEPVKFTFACIRSSNVRKTMMEIGINGIITWVCHIDDCGGEVHSRCNTQVTSSSCEAVFAYVSIEKHRLFENQLLLETLCNRLTKLVLYDCGIRRIPANLNSFTKLKHLNLQRNRLFSIQVESLPAGLIGLNVSHNQILDLPKQLLKLENLRILFMEQNAVRSLPSWLSNWKSLKILLSNGNPLDLQSYYNYWVAFRNCRLGTKHQSCTTCLTFATENMKGLLAGSVMQPFHVLTESRNCDCNKGFESVFIPPTLFLTDDDTYRTSGSLEPTALKGSISELRRFLNRQSVLSGSIRSSFSTLTLRSSTLRDLSETLPRLDKRSLMVVHCCLRQPDDIRPACVHRQVIDWICSNYTNTPCPQIFLERDLDGNSALHLAARFGAPVAALQLCIDIGCDPDLSNKDGETFLHLLDTNNWIGLDTDIWNVSKDFVMGYKSLLTRCDKRGNTAFHNSYQLQMMFEELLAGDSDPIHVCRFKRNMHGHMLHGYSTSDQTLWAPSFECDIHPSYHLAQTKEVEFFSMPSQTWTATLHLRSTQKSCTKVCFLRDVDVLHAFARLVSLGYTKFLTYPGRIWNPSQLLGLISGYDLDINSYNKEGMTVLMSFIRAFGKRRHDCEADEVEKVITKLIEDGADVDRIDRNGNTALHYAVLHGIPIAVHCIAKAGGNIHARNGVGLSVMQLLIETMHRRKSSLELFASFQQCLAILADHKAEMHPSLAQELRWDIDEL